jgi:conjugal transfer mating pair stabilization protein TraG
MITLYALSFGELYSELLSTMGLFIKHDSFMGLLRMSALIGIIMASVGYLKERNPLVYAKWFVGYVLVVQLLILPKTDVLIDDIASQKQRVVENVPVLFAATASLMTSLGVELAERYDALLSLPPALTYTQSGILAGSHVVQASRHFDIVDLELKREMADYMQQCVMGDVHLNHKYTLQALHESHVIWGLISQHASPVRETDVDMRMVTCRVASDKLNQKLIQDIKKASVFYGVGFLNQSNHADIYFSRLFETAGHYYQGMQGAASDMMRQIMLIHVISKEYKINNAWGWLTMGQKIAWFLPILHTILMGLLFGLCPIFFVMATLPEGLRILGYVLQWFVALQLWPVAFAILNAAMTLYGQVQALPYGAMNVMNFNKIASLHGDVMGITGYLMLVVPFLSKAVVSRVYACLPWTLIH